VNDLNRRVAQREGISQVTRPVWRIVVDDYDPGSKPERHDLLNQCGDVLSFVVGGDDDRMSVQAQLLAPNAGHYSLNRSLMQAGHPKLLADTVLDRSVLELRKKSRPGPGWHPGPHFDPRKKAATASTELKLTD
jgi:hypothetical protein